MRSRLLAFLLAFAVTWLWPGATRPPRFFLWGGGHMPDAVIDQFREKAAGKVVVIPAASSVPKEAVAPWVGKDNVVIFDTEDDLNDATGVWMTGGDQRRLVGSRLHERLREMSEKGILIGGTSAGASAVSDVMIYEDTEDRGFGLTRLVIDQHFNTRDRLPRLLKLIEKHPGLCGLGLDEATGVVLEGNDGEVIGKGSVTLCDGRTIKKYATGSRFSLPR